ncbi:hypothetical protein SCHAM137S_02136 [Streptomyces chartreusis]
MPVGEDAAEAFYRNIDAAYERRSIAVTSNIPPSGFDTIMPKTLAGASTDRLMHYAPGYAILGPTARASRGSGTFLPRVFWLLPRDRDRQPEGLYASGAPSEAIAPAPSLPASRAARPSARRAIPPPMPCASSGRPSPSSDRIGAPPPAHRTD